MTHNKGQSLLELVIGMGLISVIIGAIAVVTVNTLMNTQFSKNQVLATRMAQENLEKVRTIKKLSFGVCTKADVTAGPSCSTWEDIWAATFGTVGAGCITNATGCTFNLENNCTLYNGDVKPFCLRYSASRKIFVDSSSGLPNGFTGQIIIEDETLSQKRVTSKVFWSDPSGEHSSYLVTVMTRI